MSRHLARQPERGDIRMHDPQPTHHIHPHLNGAAPIQQAPSNGPHPHPPPPNGVAPVSVIGKLSSANEQTWLLIGRVAEQMQDLEHALSAYENALRHNPTSVSGLTQVAGIARIKENYPKAIDFFQRVLEIDEDNGEIWSALGHCYLMQDDLQKAYTAYQQALYLLPNPKEDPKLWYGIGILYDRYGSLDHAEEAFASVLRMCKDLDFDKENEILFRLGIIYKQQGKFEDSLNCFDRILRNPPSPLAHADIYFQIGHVYEQQKNHTRAREAYERVVEQNPGHAKVLQQLGWLFHQDGSSFQNQDMAIQYLTKSLEADPSDAQSWYLLGRAYMAGQKYNKAYEAYQQAVYRDGRNPTFWCSIGVLYFQINQFRDALDAYSRAIRINPYISEVWFDLGSLYESCNNQITDAIDAYARASELDPGNGAIANRLQLLKMAQATGGQLPAAPGPQDVHPTAYTSAVVPPPGLNGPPLMLQGSNHRSFRSESRGPSGEISLPAPNQANASGRPSPPAPFRGGPPPPVVIDESRHVPSHTPLAPMEVDRPPHSRDYALRTDPPRTVLLQHQLPPQGGPQDPRNGGHPHHPDPYSRGRAPHSRSVSPNVHMNRGRSPVYQGYHGRQPVGPAQPSGVPPQPSPRYHHREPSRDEAAWDRRPPPPDWERDDRRGPRHSGEYPPHPSQQAGGAFYPPRSPRAHSPPAPSPRVQPNTRYWDNKPGPGGHAGFRSPPSHHQTPTPHDAQIRRYDPRYDARDSREYERMEARSHPMSPEGMRARNGPPVLSSRMRSESPHPSKRRDAPPPNHTPTPQQAPPLQPMTAQFPPPPSTTPMQDFGKKERKKRVNGKRKDEGSEKGFDQRGASGSFKMQSYPKGPGSPENSSNSGSSRSIQPSPTSATPRQPNRAVDDDYDGIAETLVDLSQHRPADYPASSNEPPAHSPTISSHSRHSVSSPRPPPSHRNSISSNQTSPPSQAVNLKRGLSPGPEESDSKRSRMTGVAKRRISSPSGGRRTPVPSTRPSPIPFRTQPASHSPEAREPYPASPPLPAVFPPHPRPIGTAGAHQQQQAQSHSSGSSAASVQQLALPPIATLSPTSTAPSPPGDRDEKMQVDHRSVSPRTKVEGARSSRSPQTKHAAASPNTSEKDVSA